MITTKSNSRRRLMAVFFILFLAYICRLLSKFLPGFTFLGFLRSILHIGLFSAWGFSLNRRIVQKKVREYMVSVVFLLVFWMILKNLKYLIITDPDVDRYLWYMYYIPLLLIPLFAFLAAWYMGQPDQVYTSKKLQLLWIPTIFLLLLVLTNDFHQGVFIFPSASAAGTFTDDSYTYGMGYYIVMIWIIFLALCAFGEIVVRCRVPMEKKKIIQSLFPMLLLFVYCFLYISGIPAVRYLAGDFCIVFGLMYMAICENLIRYHMIQSNSRYADLFNASSDSSAQITDNNYTVRYAAEGAETIPEEKMRLAESGPVKLSETVRLYNMHISGGHVIWTEDISEIVKIRRELEETREELKERNALLKKEYERDKDRRTIEEQNRLYDLLGKSTQKQIEQISILVKEYEKAEKDTALANEILAHIAVLCCYVKRRKHLTLSVYSDYAVLCSELQAALQESLKTLELLHVRSKLYIEIEEPYLEGETAALAYDFFEEIVELSVDTIDWIFVSIAVPDQNLRIAIRLSCSTDLTILAHIYPQAEIEREDENEWSLILILEGGRGI